MLNENSRLKLPTKSPKVNRSGEYRPGENGFRPIGMGAVGSLAATTLENNEKFRPRERAENGLCREVGGGTGIRTGGGYGSARRASMLPRLDEIGVDDRLAERLHSLQPVQSLDQHKGLAVSANLDWRCKASLKNAFGNLGNAGWLQRFRTFDRHPN